jgi:glycosyltransferase involved in cell wall biosynthesis
MTILFISPNSPKESVGGVERYITNLIRYYQTQPKLKIFIIMPTTGESYIEKDKNVTVYYDKSFSIPRKTSNFQKLISDNAKEFAKLVGKIIKEGSIDVICAENLIFGPPAIYSLLLNMTAALHKVPLVLRLHMYPASELQIELVNQLMWKKISCVSKSVAGDCFQKGTDVNLLSTDYLGVNTEEFNLSGDSNQNLKKELGLKPENKIVLTAARILRGTKQILKEKGLINLIQAFSKLTSGNPDLRLLIAVGQASGDLKNDFEAAYQMLLGYIRIHHIENQVILKMFKLDQMPHVYRGSDVFVLPAEVNETFGQVFIEAMNCGLPVIGTKSGGIPEIISDSYNGYLVPVDDSSVLAQRIDVLINDRSVRKMFIRNGLKTVAEKFTNEKQFKLFTKLLKQATIKDGLLQPDIKTADNNYSVNNLKSVNEVEGLVI